MSAYTSSPEGQKRPPGRPKGSRNKVSKDAQRFFGRLWRDPEFRKRFVKEWRELKVPPPLMVQAAHYAFGKPVEQVEVEGTGGPSLIGPITITINGKTYTSEGSGGK
jgi:hypothetical protein